MDDVCHYNINIQLGLYACGDEAPGSSTTDIAYVDCIHCLRRLADKNSVHPSLRVAWEAGIKLARSYGDNIIRLDGREKDRQWEKFLSLLELSINPL